MDMLSDILTAELVDHESARIENKFVFPEKNEWRLLQWIRSSALGLAPTFPKRRINSIYLDSWDFANYAANMEGDPTRGKPRIRWYGEGIPDQLYLEIKLRKAQTGYKKRALFPHALLGNKVVGGGLSDARGPDGWVRALRNIPEMDDFLRSYLSSLTPNVEIRYEREYYECLNGKIRLTIDTDLRYRRYGTKQNFIRDHLAVCEIKTPIGENSLRLFMQSGFPFRISRNSKYCCAVSSVCAGIVPKKNWEHYAR